MADQGDSSTGFNRVEGLWFSDGSLVVRAENALFRVSGAVLAARSSVFQDMLSFPQPGYVTEEAENLDGVPIVELHDLAGEVEPFLRAVFDSSFFMPPPSSPQLSDILAILRLSNKYDVKYLHTRALDHLSTTYPTDLPIFLVHLNHFPAGFESLKPSADAHLRVLSVIHEVNALWLLPAAYSRASKCLPSSFFSAPSWRTLPELIKHKLHLAHAHQARHIVAVVHAMGGEPTKECDAPQTCPLEILSVVTALLEQVGQIDMEFNFFDVKDIFVPSVWEGLGAPMCTACMLLREEQVSVSMQKVWDALPTNLGLPPWDQLRAMRDAATG
ncbi:hypothetical protein K438DRAFT_1588468 [Mycena galopus ATCC 62051]|nr:hypothetical protein K438DRAFT_1588468 [Mycena galopus ATCC 62051]